MNEPAVAAEVEPVTATQSISALLNCRVLVVDDSDTNRKLLRLMLRSAGAVIEHAENGEQALDCVRAKTFDVILMDMQMPVMDGYTAAAELRRRGVRMPIIALTANAMKEDAARCIAAGCSSHLPKPINQDRLLAAVAAAVEEGRQLQPVDKRVLSSPQQSAPSAESRNDRLVSLLPTDDADFRDIVAQFVDRLTEQLAAMQTALVSGNYDELTRLAHWLKGTGGSAGFPDLTDLARQLEQSARARQADNARMTIRQLEQMARRIVLI
jgi:CheY-like chemotaxis protein/HPt (histidine-containing phosphotransfer) domain-containing protein